MAATVVLSLLLVACAAPRGWSRVDAGACDRREPPIVCFRAEPDAPVELHLGQVVVLPGECAAAPEGGRGGAIKARVMRTGVALDERWVRVARGSTTSVVAREDALVVDARSRCNRLPPPRG